MRNGFRLEERLPPFAAYAVFAAVGTAAGNGADPAAKVGFHLADKRVVA